jgi:hypothetical protein
MTTVADPGTVAGLKFWHVDARQAVLNEPGWFSFANASLIP